LLVHVIPVGREDVGQQEEHAVVLAGHIAQGAAHLGRIHGLHGVAARPGRTYRQPVQLACYLGSSAGGSGSAAHQPGTWAAQLGCRSW
nr:hypothetical protein [Tanacetum cinerariifolium]